jgi:hypothetical protein
MARMIGNTKTWLWWLGGLVCALVWGRSAGAGERREPPPPPYGVRVNPVVEKTRKQAEKLVDEYVKPVAATAPDEKAKKQIAKLIADFGAKDFATRDAASRAILKHGPAALGPLRKALLSKDAEISQRAGKAIAAIEAAVREKLVGGLKKLGLAGRNAVTRRCIAASHALGEASRDVEKLRKLAATGKAKDKEVAAARVRQETARRRSQLLGRLRSRIMPVSRPTCYLVAPPPRKKKQSMGLLRERLARVSEMERSGRLASGVGAKARLMIEREFAERQES